MNSGQRMMSLLRKHQDITKDVNAPGKEGGWQVAYSIGKFKKDLEIQKQKSKPSWIQKIKNFFS